MFYSYRGNLAVFHISGESLLFSLSVSYYIAHKGDKYGHDLWLLTLTISCVKVEMSTVELLGCLITRRPSLGCRVTLNVITRFEVLLMSLVTACKYSFVIGLEEPVQT